MTPEFKIITNYCTPCFFSSALAPGFNLGSKDVPRWLFIGADGMPYVGDAPDTFHAKQILRMGVVNLNTDGIYTEEQRDEMVDITQKGDGVNQLIYHLTQAVHKNMGTLLHQFTGMSSLLDPV